MDCIVLWIFYPIYCMVYKHMKSQEQSLSKMKLLSNISFVTTNNYPIKRDPRTNPKTLIRNHTTKGQHTQMASSMKMKLKTTSHINDISPETIAKNISSYFQQDEKNKNIRRPLHKNSSLGSTGFNPHFYKQLRSQETRKRLKTEVMKTANIELSDDKNCLNLLEVASKSIITKTKSTTKQTQDPHLLKQSKISQQRNGNSQDLTNEAHKQNHDIFETVTLTLSRISGQSKQKEFSPQMEQKGAKKSAYRPNRINLCEISSLKFQHSHQQQLKMAEQNSPIFTNRSNRYRAIEGQVDFGIDVCAISSRTLKKILHKDVSGKKMAEYLKAQAKNAQQSSQKKTQKKPIIQTLPDKTHLNNPKTAFTRRLRNFQQIRGTSKCRFQSKNRKIQTEETPSNKNYRVSEELTTGTIHVKKVCGHHSIKSTKKSKIIKNQNPKKTSSKTNREEDMKQRVIDQKPKTAGIQRKTEQRFRLRDGEMMSGWENNKNFQMNIVDYIDEQYFDEYLQ